MAKKERKDYHLAQPVLLIFFNSPIYNTANMCSKITVETQLKKCKTELQFFYCNMDKYFAVYNTMEKCRFKFTVITLHLEQQSNVKNTVNNCKIY